MFVGRDRELDLLNELFNKKTASIVTCRGRRRIGKSRLIQEFGKGVKTFLEFQGLPPRQGITSQDQLDVFAHQLSRQTSLPTLLLTSWPQAFSLLASVLKNEKTVVLLDEISWMAGTDKDFAGHLKISWDTELKKFSKLVLVVCGSVSSWIERNILGSTGFMGRESLELTLTDLPLHHCDQFWGSSSPRVSSSEKLKVLSVTGGVPRYLEEINPRLSAEENIKRLCFTREGILFSEFDHIFEDIFSSRAKAYKTIVETLIHGATGLSEICDTLDIKKNGHVSEYLDDLVASGFVVKDVSYSPVTGRPSKLARFRLKDNYLRFYLKYVEPIKENIQLGVTDSVDLESLVDWETIMGFQFENLVLNHLPSICNALGIQPNTILSASPYIQRATQRQKGCQIDLLIRTRHTLHVCEIKFRREITASVIDEVNDKILKIKKPAHMSVRPALIYEGKLASVCEKSGFFDKCVHFGDLLVAP